MSLLVDDGRRGGRSRSRSRSRDPRPRDEPQTYADVRESSYVYAEDHLDGASNPARRRDASARLPYPAEGAMDDMLPGHQSLYRYDDDAHRNASPPLPYQSHRSSRTRLDDDDQADRHRGSKYGADQGRARPADPSPRDSKQGRGDLSGELLKLLPQKYSQKYGDGGDRDRKAERRARKERDEDGLAYGPPLASPQPPRSPRPDDPSFPFASHRQGENPSSQYGRDQGGERRRPGFPDDGYRSSHRDSYRQEPSGSGANILTVEPSADRRRDRSPGPSSLGVEPVGRARERSRSRDRRSGEARDRSPRPPTARMSSLTVDTGRSSKSSLAAAPGSPLLESYRGTYQSCSPMPSPMLLASHGHGSDDGLSPLNSDVEGETRRVGRRARFHDPEEIASSIARALKGDGPPDTQPLIEVLPSLSHEQVMELRTEYKRLVKTGSERKGVNVAKHIRVRLKDEEPLLAKACYAVALGRWESEAYWANFWYQGDKTRRELLIEALMGRTNAEVRCIKDAFTDKKYDNSLTRCMKTELKEDKFKKAVLMVLEERRMEDFDSHGRRLPLDYDTVDADVDELRRAVKADKGGESAMIAIVVKRSETHLRAVLNEYERRHRANFARDALKKSGNLVGELLAHILNGVINRPVRDALLVHHALSASRRDGLRRELLISRLVRFHWDPAHMQAVKRAFRDRYGGELQDAVREATSGPWGRFCCELCIARMPNDVRRVERVQAS